MTSDKQHEQWIAQAKQRGIDRAIMAASWTVDGNTDLAHAARVLAMLRDGDPQAEDYLPVRPDLSGEFAGELTITSLYREIVGNDDWDLTGNLGDELGDAHDEGVNETFTLECEAELIKLCE